MSMCHFIHHHHNFYNIQIQLTTIIILWRHLSKGYGWQPIVEARGKPSHPLYPEINIFLYHQHQDPLQRQNKFLVPTMEKEPKLQFKERTSPQFQPSNHFSAAGPPSHYKGTGRQPDLSCEDECVTFLSMTILSMTILSMILMMMVQPAEEGHTH